MASQLSDAQSVDVLTPTYLVGRWATSYSGWMLFEPLPDRGAQESVEDFQIRQDQLPPLFGGYRYVAPTNPSQDPAYELREGYFAVAALTCFKFEKDGKLVGRTKVIRGGTGPADTSGVKRSVVINSLTGTYSLTHFPALDIYEGKIQTKHINTGGMEVTNDYAFILKNHDELEWLWAGGSYREQRGTEFISFPNPYRALVAQGTLTRMPYWRTPDVDEHPLGSGNPVNG